MLALVGPSGAGKSSIADLLHRLGVVSQYTFLFNATIAENIAFGTPGATEAQIETACQAAQAAGFIESLPDGYDTLVGERGFRLSGGQRQRIGIARALYRQAQVLVFDEATSALDTVMEQSVMEAIEGLSRELTVVIIAHRLSTVERCDPVIRLDQGKLVAQGSPREILPCE